MIDIVIKKLTTKDTDDASDKVVTVYFDYSLTDEGITATADGYKSFPDDAPYSIPYADLTENQVKGWITSDADLMATLECSIRLKWNSKKQAALRIEQPVPWAAE